MSEGTQPPEESPGKSPGGFVPPSVEDLDAVLDEYEFIEILGRGGMGAVYKGRQKSMNRLVAIKILPKVDDDDGLRFTERFQREARSMAQMSHPHIVTVYDFGQTADGQLFFVMEYVDGTDLHHVIREGRLDTGRVFKWIEQICDALFYAHSMGVVHRDIKPANIMLTKEGIVKVADFGLAKLTGGDITDNLSRLTMTNVAMGTPDYVAPEALEVGTEVDHRADIYAMGVMLYEMLTGKIPRGVWKPPSVLDEGIDPRFDDVVVKAMDSDPVSRFQQATELSTSVLAIRDQPTGTVAPVAGPRKIKLMTGPVQPKEAPAGVPKEATGPTSPRQPPAAKKKRGVRPGPGAKRKSNVGVVVAIAVVIVVLAVVVGVIINNFNRNGNGGPIQGKSDSGKESSPGLFANDHSPELEAIRWILDRDGDLRVHRQGTEHPIKTESDLPPKPWKVTGFTVKGKGFDMEGASVISAFTEVSSFGFMNSDIGDNQVLHMADAERVGGITFTQSRVTGEKFGQLKFLTFLINVNMGGSPFGDVGMSHIAKSKRLKDVDLESTKITDAGIVHLSGNSSITELDISRTAVTSKGLDQLRGLTNLKTLETGNCPGISEASRIAFQQAHPNCRLDPPLKVPAGTVPPDGKQGLIRKFAGHSDIIRGVAILPDGKLGLSVSWDKTMKLWDLSTGEKLKTFGPTSGMINSLAVSRDGKLAFTGSSDPRADFWDISAGEKIGEFIIPKPAAGGAAFSPNGSRLLIGDSGGSVFLFDRYRPQKPMNSWKAHLGSVGSITFLSDGRRFVTGGQSKRLPEAKLWSLDSAEPVRVFGPHPNGVASLAVDPTGEYLLTGGGSGDGKLRVWNLKEGGQPVRTLSGHPGRTVYSVQFSHDQRFAASSSDDRKIRIWNLNSGMMTGEFEAESYSTNYLAVSPDGRMALSGGGFRVINKLEPDGDNDLRLWQLPGVPGESDLKDSQTAAGRAATIDLLASIDPKRDAVRGEWTRKNGGLISENPEERRVISSPIEIKGVPYTLEGRLKLIENAESTGILIPVGDRGVTFYLGGYVQAAPEGKAISGLAIRGAMVTYSDTAIEMDRLKVGRAYRLKIDVSERDDQAQIRIALDDREIVNWTGPVIDLKPSPLLSSVPPHRIALSNAAGSVTRWEALTLTRPNETADAAGGDWIDLLATVDVAKDTRGGKWEKNVAGLFTDPDGVHEKLALPVRPKGSYSLNVRFQRISGDDATAIQLPVGDRLVNLVLNGWTRPGQPAKSALQPIADVPGNQPANPTMTTDFQMESGRMYGLFVKVIRDGSNARILVDVDGDRLFEWKGPLADLVYDDPASPDRGRLWLSSAGTHVRFHEAKLRMDSGSADFVR